MIFAPCRSGRFRTEKTVADKGFGLFSLYHNFATMYGYNSVGFIEFDNNSELKEINDYALYKSEKLARLELPNGLLKIGSHAFEGCKRMT